MKPNFTLVVTIVAVVLLAGSVAAAPRSVKPGDSLILGKGEEGVVDPPGLRVSVKTMESGKGAHLVVIDGKVLHDVKLKLGGEAFVGDYAVTLPRVARLCQVVVWYRPPVGEAEAIMTRYDWHADGSAPTSIPFDVPATLDGMPFHHYQLASHAMGMDLSAGAGRKLDLKRYRVREKTRGGEAIYVFLASLGPRIVGAWVSSDAPVASGITPLSSHQAEKW